MNPSIEKALNSKKARHTSHRLWNSENTELMQQEKQLQLYQKQINGYKKKKETLRAKNEYFENTDVKNELIFIERQKQSLKNDIAVLK